ncbi:hypothetical protein M153_9780001206 [Pseudoloma neurophilia]|uniref:LRR containing protein n=1 Tax=Pseudoloma neurophilia TaxID=146866 RepID=A0A0R0LVY2_9MICR|nr:hypothetical protein M153_9780001206 [Pseudoloma neurophilia]
MKKLIDHLSKKRKIETKTIDIVAQKRTKQIIQLPIDISFTLEKYFPNCTIRNRLYRRDFYKVSSQELVLSKNKHKERICHHHSIDTFSISLIPFISLHTLKLDACEYFNGHFLTKSIKNLIIYDIKFLKIENLEFDYLELGFMNAKVIENVKNCHINHLKLIKISNFSTKGLNITFNSLEIIDCDISVESFANLLSNRPFIDLIFKNGEQSFECVQNNYENAPWLKIRNCNGLVLEAKMNKIVSINIDQLNYLKFIEKQNITHLEYIGNELDFSEIEEFAKYKKLHTLILADTNIPQKTIYMLVKACRLTFCKLDIRNCEISSDFLRFIRQTLRDCQVLYLNNQCILL